MKILISTIGPCLVSLCCLCATGCQSSGLSPSRLFGAKQPERTLSNTMGQSGSSKSGTPVTAFTAGEAALAKGDYREAKKQFKLVVEQDPSHAAAHHRLGYIADRNKEFPVAEIHYLAALRVDPKNPDIACDLGYSYLLQERLADSRKYFEKALASNPQHQATLLNLATLYSKQGDYPAALAMLRQAGSEEEAQANIARLFPDGPPTEAQLASRNSAKANEVSASTRELQQKLAQGQRRPAPRNPMEMSDQELREIPPGQINDIFAQIDAEYDRARQNSPVAPANHFAQQGEYQANPAVHTQAAPAQWPNDPTFANQAADFDPRIERITSLPGNLPGPPAGGNYGQPSQMAGSGVESPYFQPQSGSVQQAYSAAPPLDLQSSPYPPASGQSGHSVPNSSQSPGPSSGQTPQNSQPAGLRPGTQRLNIPEPGSPPAAGALAMPAAEMPSSAPWATQPPATSALNPGFSPGAPTGSSPNGPALTNSFNGNTSPPASPSSGTPRPASSTASEYESALELARQWGMNAGPGQLFPVNSPATTNRAGSGSNTSQYAPQSGMNPRSTSPAGAANSEFSSPAAPYHSTYSAPQGHGQTPGQSGTVPPTADSQPPYQGSHYYGQNSPAEFSQQSPAPNQAPLAAPPRETRETLTIPAQTTSQQTFLAPPASHSPGIPPQGHYSPQYQQVSAPVVSTGMPISPGNSAAATPQQWPYSSDANDPSAQRPQVSPYVRQTADHSSAATPWLDAPAASGSSPAQPLPQMNPQAGHLVPQQWPYAPEQSPAGNGSVIHRGTQPGQNAAAPQYAPLPQVVPGQR